MRRYLRYRACGSTYFFTVCIERATALPLLVARVEALRQAIRDCRRARPFALDAIVVLPDHLHAIWTLPEGDADFSTRWARIKGQFSRGLPRDELVSPSRCLKRERGVWQRRFYEHRIRDATDLQSHIAYIHWNPVKHGLVARCSDWPFSSFHRFVRQGMLAADWGGVAAPSSLHAAEPFATRVERRA